MKKLVVIIIITAIIGLVAGCVLGYYFGTRSIMASYAGKIAEVNKLFPLPTEIYSLSGTIQNINSGVLTLKAAPITQNPFAENFPATRKIAITDATQVVKIEQKDQATYQDEMLAYQKEIQSQSAKLITPPAPFDEINIKLSDLRDGDTITVISNTNILNLINFPATKIQLMPALPSTSVQRPFPSTIPASNSSNP